VAPGALARSAARWKVAVFHQPAYSCGTHGSSPEVQREWVRLFQRSGVDLVLNGHDHDYQRFAPIGGVTYVVTGGGAELYEVGDCPAGTPHSPRFSPESFVLVLERKRRPDERDRFTWYCAKCGAELHESVKHVADYREDPVSRAYEEFYGSEAHRTCARCGHVTPRPSASR